MPRLATCGPTEKLGGLPLVRRGLDRADLVETDEAERRPGAVMLSASILIPVSNPPHYMLDTVCKGIESLATHFADLRAEVTADTDSAPAP